MNKSKLQLKRETLRALAGDALLQVAGGGTVNTIIGCQIVIPVTAVQTVCHVQITPSTIPVGPGPVEAPQPQPWKAG